LIYGREETKKRKEKKRKEKKKELIEKITSAVVDAIDCPIEAVHVNKIGTAPIININREGRRLPNIILG